MTFLKKNWNLNKEIGMKGLKIIICLIFYCSLMQQVNSQSTKYEAEDAVLSGGLTVESSNQGYSGSGYVLKFENNTDIAKFTVKVESSAYYNLYIGYSSPYGEKTNILNINGNKSEIAFPNIQSTFKELEFGKVKLKAGDNIISIEKSWGWIIIDYIRVEKNTDPVTQFQLPYSLVSPFPTNEVQRLHNYLMVNYEQNIHSGAMSLDGKEEAEWIKEKTGKYPALIGLDYMNQNRNYFWYDKTVNNKTAIDWYNRNGLVSITWHWRDPLKTTEEFYTDKTDFDVSKVNDTSSLEYKAIIADIDIIAEYLIELQASAVPILWRPLHEASGGWFWWGAKGAEPCKTLWILLFDRLVNHHGLNNLIWIWTTDARDSNLDWYPGDEYVDILGVDIYADNGDFGSQVLSFDKIKDDFEGRKMITLSENGVVPDPDNLVTDIASWSWFMPWYGDFIRSSNINPLSHWQKIMDHEYVITLDEMPDLRNYTGEVSINEFKKEQEQSIYLDSNNQLIIINNKENIETLVRVYNLSGKQVISFQEYGELIQIETNNLTSGIYIVQTTTSKGSKSIKVLK